MKPTLPAGASRTLAGIVCLGVANHVVLSGTRVAASLDALTLGASPALVGTIVALFALLPMLLALHAGRLADRVGVRRPMLVGSAGVGLGAALPAIAPGLPALFGAAILIGGSFMLFQVATQRVVGDLGTSSERASNYAVLALGYSLSGFVGPLASGFSIDQLGFRTTFAAFALVPLLPVAILASGRLALPRPHDSGREASAGRLFGLLALPVMRRLLLVNAAFALGWDLHTVFIPIYGARIGLAASEIGGILSAFAAATFAVRFAMRWLARKAGEWQLLAVALGLAAAVYLAFPFTTSTAMLTLLSFVLGLGLGAGQPLVMAQLHGHAPAGRMGEAAGLRMALIQSMSVAVPMAFGALGASLGLLPVFWCVGLTLAGGAAYARRMR